MSDDPWDSVDPFCYRVPIAELIAERVAAARIATVSELGPFHDPAANWLVPTERERNAALRRDMDAFVVDRSLAVRP